MRIERVEKELGELTTKAASKKDVESLRKEYRKLIVRLHSPLSFATPPIADLGFPSAGERAPRFGRATSARVGHVSGRNGSHLPEISLTASPSAESKTCTPFRNMPPPRCGSEGSLDIAIHPIQPARSPQLRARHSVVLSSLGFGSLGCRLPDRSEGALLRLLLSSWGALEVGVWLELPSADNM